MAMVKRSNGQTSYRKGRTRTSASFRRFGACVAKAPESASVKKENSTAFLRSQVIVTSPSSKSASRRCIRPRPPEKFKFVFSVFASDIKTTAPCVLSDGSMYSIVKFMYCPSSLSRLKSRPPTTRTVSGVSLDTISLLFDLRILIVSLESYSTKFHGGD